MKRSKLRQLHWWRDNLNPACHTHCFLSSSSTELTSLESGLAYVGFFGYTHITKTLRRPYTRRKLQNKPANTITHRALTYPLFLDTKAWDEASVTAILSPLEKGASAPNGNFASPNSTQKQHTSCSLYPSQCPPWRSWIYRWRKQTDMLASNLYVERVDPLGTVVMIRTPPAWTSKDYTLLRLHFINFMFEFPCIVSLYYIRNQQDATLAVSFISTLQDYLFRTLHQWLLLQFLVLLMMDAESVRNM